MREEYKKYMNIYTAICDGKVEGIDEKTNSCLIHTKKENKDGTYENVDLVIDKAELTEILTLVLKMFKEMHEGYCDVIEYHNKSNLYGQGLSKEGQRVLNNIERNNAKELRGLYGEKLENKVYEITVSKYIDNILTGMWEDFQIKKQLDNLNMESDFLELDFIDSCKQVNRAAKYKPTIKEKILQNILMGKSGDILKRMDEYVDMDELFPDYYVTDFIFNCMDKQELQNFIKSHTELILPRKNVIDAIVKSGKYFETRRELYSCINPEQLVSMLFSNNFNEDAILESNISEEELLRFMVNAKGKKIYNRDDKTDRIWDLFEKGKFSVDGVKFMAKLAYVSTNRIIDLYYVRNTRKIAIELGETQPLDNEKILEYFTPQRALKEIQKNPAGIYEKFYREDLRVIYEAQGRDYAKAIVDEVRAQSQKDNDDDAYVSRIMKLHSAGYIDTNALIYAHLPENTMEAYIESHPRSESDMIEMFNNGLITVDYVQDKYDTDELIDLVSKGMSARAISGLGSTADYINLIKPQIMADENNPGQNIIIPPRLEAEQLADIKDEFVIGIDEYGSKENNNGLSKTLLELYANGEFNLAELYELEQAGIINAIQFEAIKNNFDIKEKWEQLKEQGIVGNPIDGFANTIDADNQSISNMPYGRKHIGIDEDCVWDLYMAMGADEYMEIDGRKCPVFKGYTVIPIFADDNLIHEDIAFLESNEGRTYMLPLKIVLEQIVNPEGNLDLIGNAVGRNDFNSNKTHVRSVNHTRNWAINLIMKTADLPMAPYSKDEAREMIESNETIMEAIRACTHSYDNRKFR